MADNIALTTLGIKVGYALETNITKASGKITAITASVWLQDIKSTPALDAEAEALETTTLAETVMKTYVQGLKDLGGSIEFTSNLTNRLITEWGNFYTGTTGAKKEGAIVIWHPDLTKMFVVPCQAQALGLPEAAVNSVYEATVRVTPTAEVVQVEKVEPVAPSAVVGGGD